MQTIKSLPVLAVNIFLTGIAVWSIVNCQWAESALSKGAEYSIASGPINVLTPSERRFEMKRAEHGKLLSVRHLLNSFSLSLYSDSKLSREDLEDILSLEIYATRAGANRSDRMSLIGQTLEKEGCALFDNPKMRLLALESEKRGELKLWVEFSGVKCPNAE